MKTLYKIKKRLGMARTWILDNGHGKLTAGKRSPVLEDGRQFFEYEFNRDIVERLKVLMDAEGIPYYDLVPDYEKLGNFVMGRIGRANALPNPRNYIYLSVHANAAGRSGWDSSVEGIEIFYESHEGLKIAKAFLDNLAPLFNRNRGTKRRTNDKGEQYYAVLRETKMVAVLLELGFYTHPEEVKKLLDGNFRQQIAVTLFETIKQIEDGNI